MKKDIPRLSLQRMPVYLNYLRSLPETNENRYISSGAIANALALGEVLVRKDLAYTDCIGRPKVGYDRRELICALEDFLCCNSENYAVVVGAGGLGSALLSYDGFSRYGVKLVAAFDSDPEKTGKVISGKPVYDISLLKEKCTALSASLAVITVPAAAAQSVADSLADAGVKAILNFAPVQLKVDGAVKIINMDVAANLAVLVTMI